MTREYEPSLIHPEYWDKPEPECPVCYGEMEPGIVNQEVLVCCDPNCDGFIDH